MASLQEEFGNNFRRIRKSQKLSQDTVAKRIGMASTYISQVEAGKINLTLATIEKLAQGLEVELANVFEFLYVESVTPSQIRKNVKAIINEIDDRTITKTFERLTYNEI